MSVKPILFSGPMVKAILAGRKTQTRRAMKPQPQWDDEVEKTRLDGLIWPIGRLGQQCGAPMKLPRFKAGDLLYVRETWKPHSLYDHLPPRSMPQANVFYEADVKYSPSGSRARPGIHMPRWASRITLVVEDVRVERLQEISEDDADAEGFGGDFPSNVMPEIFHGDPDRWGHLSMRECYGRLWESINGAGSWEANPFVVAITFRPILANVGVVLADPAAYGIREAA